jgi:hypothetical protein
MNRDFVDNLRKAGVIVTELTPEQHKAFVDSVALVYYHLGTQNRQGAPG